MRNFKLILHLSLDNHRFQGNEILKVLDEGKYIGNCNIAIEGNNIVGHFILDDDISSDKYILYCFPVSNFRNLSPEFILFIDYNKGLEKSAKKISEMDSME
jgi:hypothetical protein